MAVASEAQDTETRHEEPDIYDFTEPSGYSVGGLEPAYDAIGDSYWADEENEKIVIEDSSWDQVQQVLEEDGETQEQSSGWKSKLEGYLSDHDKTYAKGGLLGMGSGLVSGALGYSTAADFLFTGGLYSFAWGIGGMAADYIWGGDEESSESDEDIEHELDEYSRWDVEVLDMESYGQAVEAHREE